MYENNFSSPRCVLDKNFPEISIEDGSLFTFFNKNIECETLFAAKQQKLEIDPFNILSLNKYLTPYSYYFLSLSLVRFLHFTIWELNGVFLMNL